MTMTNILHRTLLPITLLAPLSLACGVAAEQDDGAPAAACEENPEAPAPPSDQGGLRPRIIAHNGRAFQGSHPQGVELQGTTLNGLSANGLSANGLSANGLTANGLTANGLSANGLSANGSTLNAIAPNAIAPNALTGNGIHHNGAGNELVGLTADGKLIQGEAFVGAKLAGVLSDGSTVELAVTGFERSADGKVAWYQIEHEGQNVCGDGGKGMFVPGSWDATGARHDSQTVGGNTVAISYSCAKGVIAKCVTWGYAPWVVGADLHQACTRMARADYCGSGVPFTKDGTEIDLYDVDGVQKPAGDASFRFEAAWGPNGAVCVSRRRYDARTTSGDAVLPSCWSSLPSCGSLEEGRAAGAVIGNSSRLQSRTFCR